MKDKDPIQVEIAQALADGRLRTALVVNAEGIAVQHGDRSPAMSRSLLNRDR